MIETFQNVVASPVRPAPGYNGSPTSSSSASAVVSKTFSIREPVHEAGNGSSSPSGSTGSSSSCGVRKISSSESERGKMIVNSLHNIGNRTSSSPVIVQTKAQPKYVTSLDSAQPMTSKEENQRVSTVLPSTPVGFSQQQISEMEFSTSRYLRQLQQQQQIQTIFQQQLQPEPRRPASRSGCFDTQLNVLRQEMARVL